MRILPQETGQRRHLNPIEFQEGGVQTPQYVRGASSMLQGGLPS